MRCVEFWTSLISACGAGSNKMQRSEPSKATDDLSIGTASRIGEGTLRTGSGFGNSRAEPVDYCLAAETRRVHPPHGTPGLPRTQCISLARKREDADVRPLLRLILTLHPSPVPQCNRPGQGLNPAKEPYYERAPTVGCLGVPFARCPCPMFTLWLTGSRSMKPVCRCWRSCISVPTRSFLRDPSVQNHGTTRTRGH